MVAAATTTAGSKVRANLGKQAGRQLALVAERRGCPTKRRQASGEEWEEQ